MWSRGSGHVRSAVAVPMSTAQAQPLWRAGVAAPWHVGFPGGPVVKQLPGHVGSWFGPWSEKIPGHFLNLG